MKNEIGSEFWSVPQAKAENGLFPTDTKWFISGTAALYYIIDDILSHKKIKTAALPSWCCSSMVIPFLKCGIKVEFYPVKYQNGKFTVDCSLVSADAVLVMDYFGFSSPAVLPQGYDGTVICDITHSVMRSAERRPADYYFGSLRKWAGFWTGGYAFAPAWKHDAPIDSVNPRYIELRRSAMEKKQDYICGASDSKDYLQIFDDGEDYLDSTRIESAAGRDITAARYFDVDAVKSARIKNAKLILDELGSLAVFPSLRDDDCPLFVPIIVPDGKRDSLKKYLIQNEIYCPAHWPLEDVQNIGEAEKYLYDNELSLVCDQRYDTENIGKIITAVKSFLNL